MDMLFVMLHDMLRYDVESFLIVVQPCHINLMTAAVFWIIKLLRINSVLCNLLCKNRTLILYRETQHIPIRNCIFDHIPMQAGIQFRSSIENISSGTSINALILLKNRGSGKSNIIGILKM